MQRECSGSRKWVNLLCINMGANLSQTRSLMSFSYNGESTRPKVLKCWDSALGRLDFAFELTSQKSQHDETWEEFSGCILRVQMYLPFFSSLVTIDLCRQTKSMQSTLQTIQCKQEPSSGTWSDCQPLLYSLTRILSPGWPRIPAGEWADLGSASVQPHPPKGWDCSCALRCPALSLPITF